jgi:hypothetical protein
MKLKFSRLRFDKSFNIEFHQNPSTGSRVVQCGRTNRQTNGQKDITLIVVFNNFAKASKKLNLMGTEYSLVMISVPSIVVHLA